MFDIPVLINLFITLIELKNINQKRQIKKHTFLYLLTYFYPCDFVLRDIKIDVHLESPRKINFNLGSDFLSK